MRAVKEGHTLWSAIIRTTPAVGTVDCWSLGQEGFVFRTADGPVIMVDPYLSNSIFEAAGEPWRRAYPPVLEPSACTGLRYVLITHHHEDHLDAATLVPMARSLPDVRFVLPRAHVVYAASLGLPEERLIAADPGIELKLDGGLTVHPLAGMHERLDVDEAGNPLYLGYVLQSGGITWFHAGDTIGFPELAEQVKALAVELVLLPINGRDFTRSGKGIQGNMNFREASDFCAAVGADVLLPMHIGLFPHNDENPAYLIDYAYRQHPGQRIHLLQPGELYTYRGRNG